MKKDTTFSYTYSASRNKEIEEIRSRYVPKTENKLEELKRLDHTVQLAGILPSLCIGIIGCLLFAIGVCLALNVMEKYLLLEIFTWIVGIVGMIAAYPVYRHESKKAKAKYTPRILQLVNELGVN